MSNSDTTFILADTQELSRLGVGSIIGRRHPRAAIAEVNCHNSLVDALKHYPGAIVVLDYARFDIPSVERLLIMMSRFAEARWVILSDEMAVSLVRRLSGEPAVSFAHKSDSADDIALALKAAAGNQRFTSASIAKTLSETVNAEPITLTTAETEILALIARGMTSKEIATHRCSSIHTIITHKKNIFRKIGVSTTHEATRYAIRAGLADPIEYYL